MPEKRLIVPPWMVVKPKSLEDKENTPYEPPEKKLKKHSSHLEGMANPKCGSSQSPRLDDLVKLPRDNNSYHKDCFIVHPDALPLDIQQRQDRQFDAREFRRDYTYGITTFVNGCKKTLGHAKERKTCIWSGGGKKSSWLCKSSGIMWVAVHGADSVCVVTKAEKVDRTRVDGDLSFLSGGEILHRFWETVISEIEDLADPSSGLHELFALDISIRKPLGVVSVTEGFDKFHAECIHEAPSSADFDEEKAVEFLQEKMKRGLEFTYNETIQTAIHAFQQLFQKKFTAKEIRVCTWKYEDDIGFEVPYCEIKKFIVAE